MSSNGSNRTSTRQIEILTLCKAKPRTKKWLAEHFNVNYHTVRKDVDFLHKIGQLKPSAYGSGDTSVLWESTDSFQTKGLRFHLRNSTHTIDEVVNMFSAVPKNIINKKFAMVAATICTLHAKAQRKQEGFESGPPIDHLQRILIDSRDAIKQMELLIDQLLGAPIWEADDNALLLLKGIEDIPELYTSLNEWFTKEYINYYDPLFEQEDNSSKKSN